MIGALLIFLAEMALNSPSSSSVAGSPNPGAPIGSPFSTNVDNTGTSFGAPANLAQLQTQFPQSAFVGDTYNSLVVNNPIVQQQQALVQTQAIQQQIKNQIASAKTTISTPSGTPPVVRAPSGSTRSFN